MSISDADIAFARDLFSDLGPVSHRKMFGGVGLYLDGRIFAIATRDGGIFLKACGAVVSALEAEGARQFKGMPYWSLPESALDDPVRACDWARTAIAAEREVQG